MTKFEFYLARVLRNEGALKALSIDTSGLTAELKGQSVALIGNARALATCSYGANIDAHDLVIRINRAPMPSVESHGTRTDWLALATRISDQDRKRIGASRILWMSHKRKRLDWKTASTKEFYLHPLSDYERVKAELGRQPTTGAMLIDLLVRSDAAKIDLYGFDFFSSLSLSGRRAAADVPHDFDAEARYVHRLVEHDPRLTLHPMK